MHLGLSGAGYSDENKERFSREQGLTRAPQISAHKNVTRFASTCIAALFTSKLSVLSPLQTKTSRGNRDTLLMLAGLNRGRLES